MNVVIHLIVLAMINPPAMPQLTNVSSVRMTLSVRISFQIHPSACCQMGTALSALVMGIAMILIFLPVATIFVSNALIIAIVMTP